MPPTKSTRTTPSSALAPSPDPDALRQLWERLAVLLPDNELLGRRLWTYLSMLGATYAGFDDVIVSCDRVDDAGPEASVDAAVVAFMGSIAGAEDVLSAMPLNEVREAAARAADQMVASLRWSEVVGDRLNTSDVTDMLRVTRQALAKRQAAGSLLGLPGDGTTWFPVWQFDAGAIRPAIREIIGAFRDRLDDPDPFTIASWASTPQPELKGDTPAEWLRRGGETEPVRLAAARAAAGLAQ